MHTPEFRGPEEGRPRGARPDPSAGSRGVPREPPGADRRSVEIPTSRSVTPLVGAPIPPDDPIGFPLSLRQLDASVRAALHEDGAFADVATVACVRSNRHGHGMLIARRGGVIAGVPLAIAAFRALDPNVAIRVDVDDGGRVVEGTVIMRVSGLTRGILSAERVALNYLQRLSGVATLAARYVDAVRGSRAQILVTRSTTPGLRQLEQYAVRAGTGLDRDADASVVRIRENHLAAVSRDVTCAVERSRELAPAGARIAVDCRSPADVDRAVAAGADIVVFDDLSPDEVRACVDAAHGRVLTEVSGPVTLETAPVFARLGVDRITVAALTQYASGLDVALELEAA
jgi:nicotinate-nucleotide pyrophosphorylase (carboxylating)